MDFSFSLCAGPVLPPLLFSCLAGAVVPVVLLSVYDAVVLVRPSSRSDLLLTGCGLCCFGLQSLEHEFLLRGLRSCLPAGLSCSCILTADVFGSAGLWCRCPHSRSATAAMLLLSSQSNCLLAEVSQLCCGSTVRGVCLGQPAGVAAASSSFPMLCPVLAPLGAHVLGRIFNVLGSTIDNRVGVGMHSCMMCSASSEGKASVTGLVMLSTAAWPHLHDASAEVYVWSPWAQYSFCLDLPCHIKYILWMTIIST